MGETQSLELLIGVKIYNPYLLYACYCTEQGKLHQLFFFPMSCWKPRSGSFSVSTSFLGL